MIPPEYIPAIAERLKTLQGPVKIDYFHQTDGALIVPGRQPCPGCAPALELLQELAALHDELELRVHDFHSERAAADKWGAERVPGLVIHGEVNRPLRFYGVPGGAFLSILIDVIVGASAKPSAASAELTALIKKLRARVHLRVVGSFQHPESARAAATAFALALLSDKIDASVFTLEDCPDHRDETPADAHPADAGQRPARLPGRDDVAGAGAVLPRRAEQARGGQCARDRARLPGGDQAARATTAARRRRTRSRHARSRRARSRHARSGRARPGRAGARWAGDPAGGGPAVRPSAAREAA